MTETVQSQEQQQKRLPLEKKLAAGVCLAFGLSLVITARTTKFLYKRLQQPVEPTLPKMRLRDLKRPGTSFDFMNNQSLLENASTSTAGDVAGQAPAPARPSLRGMVSFMADGWREEEKPPRPEDFNPAKDAAKALGLATAAVFGCFGAASGALLWSWGVTDVSRLENSRTMLLGLIEMRSSRASSWPCAPKCPKC